MTVRFDKDVPGQPGASVPVSLHKPKVATFEALVPVQSPAEHTARVPLPRTKESDTRRRVSVPPAPHGSPAAQPRFGRAMLSAAFVLGATTAGSLGAIVVSNTHDDLAQARALISAAQRDNKVLDSRLGRTTEELTDTTGKLDAAQAEAAAVAARESRVTATEAELAQRAAALDKRDTDLAARAKQVAATERGVKEREAALVSRDVGHPLLDMISEDGTWVAGRDISPGTWTSPSYDTGCTWRTSDGRSGGGDGGYQSMDVDILVGQSFTVHGCSMWSTFAF